MNLRNVFCGIAMAGVLLFPAELAFAQEKSKGDEKAPAMSQEMMKRWMDAATPGEGHKLLDQFVGKWEVSTRMWIEGPGKPPAETKATVEGKWIMDGRYVQEDSTSQVMGMPHKSIGITGYDNIKKKYVMSYIDNMGTSIYTAEGTLDESGKVMTLFGKFDEPMTGERDKIIKFVTRLVGPDKHIFEIYDLVGTPDEFKSLEMTYARKR
ncbi:MAG TPA: DUF1579 domain-containing protein [Blastocatellia bacterium]|jgi:hypothetical protein|nr:DUF1579 domain-containing protein [Blastocatellia bacterium]